MISEQENWCLKTNDLGYVNHSSHQWRDGARKQRGALTYSSLLAEAVSQEETVWSDAMAVEHNSDT